MAKRSIASRRRASVSPVRSWSFATEVIIDKGRAAGVRYVEGSYLYHASPQADPKGALPPYDAVLLVSPQHAKDAALIAALMPLVHALDLRTMQRANLAADRAIDKRTPDDIRAFYAELGPLSSRAHTAYEVATRPVDPEVPSAADLPDVIAPRSDPPPPDPDRKMFRVFGKRRES